MAISYTAAASFNIPESTTVDACGNIWVANAGNNSLAVVTQVGTPLSGSPFSGNGLSTPTAAAIDLVANAGFANQSCNAVSVFTPYNAPCSVSPFPGAGTISRPSAIAIDASGNIQIANGGNGTVTELTGTSIYIKNMRLQ